ncbi:MAG: hypothetical protein ACHQKZ_11535, partial [Solirubrobacterales bacterium]
VSPAVAARLDALFDPTEAVRAKAAPGGTAPEAVLASLDALRVWIDGAAPVGKKGASPGRAECPAAPCPSCSSPP